MEDKLVKIVDTFNGFEGDQFATIDEAEKALEREIEEFHAANPGAMCKKAIVPVSAEWYFDQRQNKFIWG